MINLMMLLSTDEINWNFGKPRQDKKAYTLCTFAFSPRSRIFDLLGPVSKRVMIEDDACFEPGNSIPTGTRINPSVF